MTQKATTRWRLSICLLNKTSSRVFKKPSAIWAGKVRNTRETSKERKTVGREVIHRPTDIYPLLFVFILVTHIDPRELFFHTSKASYFGLTRCGKKRGKKGKRKKRKGEIKMVKRFFCLPGCSMCATDQFFSSSSRTRGSQPLQNWNFFLLLNI